jgi:hypothetical protein
MEEDIWNYEEGFDMKLIEVYQNIFTEVIFNLHVRE